MSRKNYPAVSGSSPDEYYEDELATWLQYPSEDSLEKGYCADVFGRWPPTVSDNPRLLPGIGSLKASTGTDLSKLYCAQASTDETKDRVGTGPLPRTSNTEGALALGAQRAAGLAPQWSGDAFSKVRTAMQPPPVSHLTPAATEVVGKQYESVQVTVVEPAGCQISKAPLAPAHGGPHMLRRPPQSSAGVAAPAERGAVPQSIPFSASRLQNVPCAPLQTSSVHESGCSGLTELASANQVGSKHASSAISGGDLYISKGSSAMPVSRPASISVLADRRTVVERVSLPSSSGLSPACTMLSSRDASSYSGKRKFEDSESHSEYVQDVAVELSMDVKQPHKTSKKNRASEFHNLSERNRRNRINEKLKALQDLIPDASKTDKASILDEAIEYMKTLQMQLQMVSMRSGMHVSPMMIPLGMPHLQMDPFHPVGLGVPVGPVGMGMGMGMHMSMGTGMMEMPQGIMTRALSIAPNQFSVPYLGRSVVGSQGCDLDYMNIVSAPSQFAHAAQNPPEPFSQMRLAAESLPRAHLQQQQEQWQYSGELSCGSESVKHYNEKVSRKE